MKKTKVLALVLIFAFASLGGAYATLYDHLYINEDISTAHVNVSWADVSSNDAGNNIKDYPTPSGRSNLSYDGTNQYVFKEKNELDHLDAQSKLYNEQKNIGSLNFGENGNGVLQPDDGTVPEFKDSLPASTEDPVIRTQNDLLSIQLKNGYPGYQQYITATIKNYSEIPVKFEIQPASDSPDPTDPSDPNKTKFALVGSGAAGIVPDWMWLEIVDASDDSKVYFRSTSKIDNTGTDGTGDLEGCKLERAGDKGDSITVKIRMRILESAPEGVDNCRFNLQLRAIQWNEYGRALDDNITLPY